jgi:hypothetical protein
MSALKEAFEKKASSARGCKRSFNPAPAMRRPAMPLSRIVGVRHTIQAAASLIFLVTAWSTSGSE